MKSNCLSIKLVHKIAKLYNQKVRFIIDNDGLYCVFIDNLDRIKSRKYLSNLEGRGNTKEEACVNYILNLLDSSFNIRYSKNIYATEKVRRIIKKSKFNEVYKT